VGALSPAPARKKAVLVLETGRVFHGWSFGASKETSGEVVFCTSMTGYQEILTDPSYQGQIVVMTYPHIGNYGTHANYDEAKKPFAAGFVAKEFSDTASHWQTPATLSHYMESRGVSGIDGLDTRALVRHLRERGVCQGIIATGDIDEKALVKKAQSLASMEGKDLVKEVSCRENYHWGLSGFTVKNGKTHLDETGAPQKQVVVVDFGVKNSILQAFAARNCGVTVVPGDTSAKDILALNPGGIMLSNGPGDPAAVGYGIKMVQDLVAHNASTSTPTPVFGICLGHQILGLALGAKTYKLKFGHRGANHPVKDLTTGRVEVTTQNHGFAVEADTLAGKPIELTHINLNDGTVEGLRHKDLPVFSVQYHPEASPGPHDAHYLFERFITLIKNPAGVR
jgi:carbamoyl-phosphate synthase small subunit